MYSQDLLSYLFVILKFLFQIKICIIKSVSLVNTVNNNEQVANTLTSDFQALLVTTV